LLSKQQDAVKKILPHRNYDKIKNMNCKRLYKAGAIVFITIVTSRRRNILIDNIELVKYSIKNAHKFYQYKINELNFE